MRILIIVAGILAILGVCNSLKKPRREFYYWENYERIPFDHGKVNLNTVILLSHDSVNILKDSGVLIDPRDEVVEPERPVPAIP